MDNLESAWAIAKATTHFENERSFILRIVLGALSYCFIYTRIAGTLLNALAYLTAHHWYVLAVTCSIVVLLISGAQLALLQWMFDWQGRLFATLAGPHGSRRILTVDDDDDESMMFWGKRIGRFLLICCLWALYCYVNVSLDYMLFWHQYSVGNPRFNLELFLVNSLQAGPILLGAAYTIYHLWPSFFVNTRASSSGEMASPLPSNPEVEHHMQSLLS